MHYYEHHIGDFMRDTAHLEPIEECFYRRALDWYYANEKPLPLDVKKVCRALRAKSKAEITAVEIILEEFFDQQDDGYRQSRCDRVIAEFNELEPEREAKKENAKERQRRTRERRKEMFEFLRCHNIVPKYDAPMAELQRLVDSISSPSSNTPVTRDMPVTSQLDSNNATATHYPVPTTHINSHSLSGVANDFPQEQKPELQTMEDWQPSLDTLNTKLKMAGAMAITQATLDQTLVTFNPHYESQHLSDNKLLAKLVTWIKSDQERQKTRATLKPTSSRPAKTNLHPNRDWENQPPPEYDDIPLVDVSDMI